MNREDVFEDKKSEGDASDRTASPRKRQRVRLTREEMQVMTERKRNYERGAAAEDSDTPYERRRTDYAPRPRQNFNYNEDGGYKPRRNRYDEDEASSAPSYRDRYRAEHAGGGDAPQRNNYRTPRNDRGDYGDKEGGFKPRHNNHSEGGFRNNGPRRPQGNGGFGQRGQKFQKDNNGSRGNYGSQNKGSKTQKKAPQRSVKQRPHYEFQDQETTDTSVRLNKFLAHAGVASRREADQLILAGAVVVNGTPVLELGTKVLPTDRVEVNGKVLSVEEKVYVLLNKPRNVVTTTDDPQERLTVLNLVKNAATERIYPVGRLDRNTTGVLLLTNDGDLASKLVHPSFKKKKIYQVWLDKEVAPEDMQKLADGVELSDGEMHADAISYVEEDDHTQVGIEIHSGKNRVVRRLFEALGYRVVKLDRVYFAGLTKKNLGRGKWRYLTEMEVINLKNGAFE